VSALPLDVVHFPGDPRPAEWRQPVVAVGNFDGLHRGHMKIVDRVCRQAAERATTPVVLTFDPHPARVIRPDKAPPLLMTRAQKLEALALAGVRGVAVVRFTPDLAAWSPEAFVQEVIVEWLRAAEVWVGANFLFGHDRAGNFSLLRTLGAHWGFRAEKIDPVRYKEFVVSSTRVRRLIGEGRVDEAAALLGHHYSVDGVVVHGDGRGKALGVPTANFDTDNELLPPNGVYATVAGIDGVLHASITNVGMRPTFGNPGGRPTVESHVFDFARDLYGVSVRLMFLQRLREERTFPDADALVEQIATDCRRARQLFDAISL